MPSSLDYLRGMYGGGMPSWLSRIPTMPSMGNPNGMGGGGMSMFSQRKRGTPPPMPNPNPSGGMGGTGYPQKPPPPVGGGGGAGYPGGVGWPGGVAPGSEPPPQGVNDPSTFFTNPVGATGTNPWTGAPTQVINGIIYQYNPVTGNFDIPIAPAGGFPGMPTA